MDCEFGHGFLLFSIFKQVSENLGLFLLFAIGFKLLITAWEQIMWDLRGKKGKSKSGFCSKFVLCGKFGFDEPLIGKPRNIKEKSNIRAVCDKESSTDADEVDFNHGDEKDLSVEVSGFDVHTLRNLVKFERYRANAALVELEKERAASATATEETMAMITRLQNEKSTVELELRQYRRLAEEKQIHDQEVIESLQWVVRNHESEMELVGAQLKSCKRCLSKIDESDEVEEALSPFKGNILDALENVLYSSRDVYMSPE